MENNFAHNLRNLRESFGETQTQLMEALDLESVGAISNYESGRRMPDRDILLRIAAHYRVTVDTLLYSDLNYAKMDWQPETKGKHDRGVRLLSYIFPISSSKQAREDPLFLKGVERHNRMFTAFREGGGITVNDVDECMEAYETSFRENNTLASAANLISFYILTLGFFPDDFVFPYNLEFQTQSQPSRVLLECYLRNYENGEQIRGESPGEEESWASIRAFIDQEIVEMLVELKKSASWSPLADYFAALRYVLGMADVPITEELKNVAGIEMMRSLSQFGNRYATRFAKIWGLT